MLSSGSTSFVSRGSADEERSFGSAQCRIEANGTGSNMGRAVKGEVRLDPYFQRRLNKRVGHCEGGIGPFSPRTRASLPRRSAPEHGARRALEMQDNCTPDG